MYRRVKVFVTDIFAVHFFCILFGAPFFDKFLSTLLFSVLFVVVTGVRPTRIYARRERWLAAQNASAADSHASAGIEDDIFGESFTRTLQVLLPPREQVFVVLALAGSILAPLDWAVWWQEWPLPSGFLVACGAVAETIRTAVVSRPRRKLHFSPI